MSSADLADFWVHTVTVQTYRGKAGNGTLLYAAAVTVPCFVTRKLRFVRDANGEQVPSGATLSADTSWAPSLTPQSIVTLDARDTTIISTALSTSGDLDLPDRVKAFLQ